MTSVTITEAKRRFSELAERVAAGESITVTRDGEPVLDLVPHSARRGGLDVAAVKTALDELGVQKYFTRVAGDFDEPLPEDFLITPET